MNKEQAYERLELPVGSDLQTVRKKFSEMHNDYRMRIENAPTPRLKQTFERGLEELKEAYALLNESDRMDDSAELPRTDKMFEQIGSDADIHQEGDYSSKSIAQSLALFGLTERQDIAEIQKTIQQRLEKLQVQYKTVDIPVAKDAYKQETLKAEKAKDVINNWITKQKLAEQGHTPIPSLANQTTSPTSLSHRKINALVYIVPLLLLGMVIYFVTKKPSNSPTADDPTPNAVAAKDSLTQLTTGASTPLQDVQQIGKQGFGKGTTSLTTTSSENKAPTTTNTIKGENSAVNAKIKKWEEKSQWSAIGFYEDFARVDTDGKYGYINRQGDVVIPLKYDYAESFSEGMAAVEIQGKWGYINKEGKVMIPFKYYSAYDFWENMAKVTLNGKSGYINKQGKVIVPLKYSTLDTFSEGLAMVSLDNKWGFVDKSGNEVIPLKYRAARDFKNGVARVYDGERWFYINNQGQCVADCRD